MYYMYVREGPGAVVTPSVHQPISFCEQIISVQFSSCLQLVVVELAHAYILYICPFFGRRLLEKQLSAMLIRESIC